MRIGGMDMRLRFVRPGAAAVPPSTLLDGLVSYWTLDEESGTRADSVGDNDLTDNNTVGYDTGKNGNAASFVASNGENLSIADNDSLSTVFSSVFSVSVWLNPSAVSNDGWLSRVPDMYAVNNTGINYFLIGGAYGYFDPLAAGQWAHLIWVFDGSQSDNAGRLKLYQNGEAKTLTFSGTIPDTVPDTNQTTYVGSYGPAYHWNGLMDGLGLWSRVLTSDERAELYNGGSGKFYPFT